MPWNGPEWFTVGTVARHGSLRRKDLTGPLAVRVPSTQDGIRYHAPAALVTASADETPSYRLQDATQPAVTVCVLMPEKGGARYRVTGAQGEELGLVHRTPAAKRAVQHNWWLRQPGHPDVVARYHWARGSARDVVERGKVNVVRGAGAVVEGVVDSLLSFGAEDDSAGRPHTPKPVTWRADDEVALTSEQLGHVRAYLPKAVWLDRRLAFALAVLRQA
ncbi:hypothetical protein [Streptomyces sp. NPDC014006]|uniref:hypothetical protein n=1 Tax=Streptomyces sp. NPDC014006 TaxID=3364870 RepID=UPI0036FB63E3